MWTSVIVYTVIILTGINEVCPLHIRESEWTFQSVRKYVDFSKERLSATSVSLIGCVSFCSDYLGQTVSSLYYREEIEQCACDPVTDSAEDDKEPQIVYGTRIIHYKDCASLSEALNTKDGVYTITPSGGQKTDTWCDMTNGGWTVILRRMDGSENFYRGWDDYVAGFGNRSGEYFLGLETIHRLTKNGGELVVFMEAYPEAIISSMTSYYSNFTVGDVNTNYILYISGFNGTCGDSLQIHNGQQFTTFDKDNDKGDANCAVAFKAAWWYNACHDSHLTGQYYKRGKYSRSCCYATGIHWVHCWSHNKSAKFAVMKIKGHP